MVAPAEGRKVLYFCPSRTEKCVEVLSLLQFLLTDENGNPRIPSDGDLGDQPNAFLLMWCMTGWGLCMTHLLLRTTPSMTCFAL